ncbi:MAG: hypothetical protein LUG18_00490 [Candidatus Azobacteroides sp.]|nr:hypothetical protein [Candidatus Azobacteroides sp.]
MIKKKYSLQREEESQKIGESATGYPVIPSTPFAEKIILQEEKKTFSERKTELINTVLNDTDEQRFEELEFYFHLLYRKEINSSCQYSVEELRDKYDNAVKQVKAGEVLTHEEVKNRYRNF